MFLKTMTIKSNNFFENINSEYIQKQIFEFLARYKSLEIIICNKNKTYNSDGPNGPSYACYITYSSEEESSLAILTLDNCTIDNHEIHASLPLTYLWI